MVLTKSKSSRKSSRTVVLPAVAGQGKTTDSPEVRIWEVPTLALGMHNSSVEAMQDFGSLLRKSPASLLVMLMIDECSAPNRGVYFVRPRLAIRIVSFQRPNNESGAVESGIGRVRMY
jgi:hypothetical protein